MKENEILQSIFALQDLNYKSFTKKIIPNVEPDRIIGVRTPPLRLLAKELAKNGGAESFIKALPHRYFEENQLHAFIVSEIRDYGSAIAEINAFLPHIDNWATCDQTTPRAFARHKDEVLREIDAWLDSEHTYTVRFGVGMLMRHFLDEDFRTEYAERVAAVRSGEYYIDMMAAWYFATALAKQYDAVLPFIEARRLNPWTHNKAIQKATESYRVPDEHKNYLKTLKIKK
ncbi:MAG: DNA alkylation repair protein [Oscillospiraceae bacterium]|nr:DNA alkylation repair protein [Oscillospiraceae bacterium]